MSISKPLTAYHYYISKMRSDWNNLTDEEKRPFIEKAKKDSTRYNQELAAKKQLEYIKTKEKNVFLSRYYGRVPCVGLDNGWYNIENIGPAERLEEYDMEEQYEMNIQYKKITIDGFTYTHNKQYYKKYQQHIYTTGRAWKNHDCYYRLSDNKTVFHKTFYTNYKGESWEVDI